MGIFSKRMDYFVAVGFFLFYFTSEIHSLKVVVNPPVSAVLTETQFELTCAYALDANDIVPAYGIAWQKETSSNNFLTIATFSPPKPPQPDPNLNIAVKNEYINRTVLTNPTSGSLIAKFRIETVECTDEGRYQCSIQYTNPNGGGTLTNSTTVTINAKAQRPYEIPTMNPDQNIEENQNVTFSCTADVGKPPGQILWWKYRVNISAPFFLSSATQTPPQVTEGVCSHNVTSTIQINLKKEDDQSVIRCSVNQSLLSGLESERPHRNSERINVYYKVRPPLISKHPGLAEYAIGTQVKLTCSTAGNPQPGGDNVDTAINKYVWMHQRDDDDNGTEVASVKGVLTLTNVQLEQTGRYTCTAHNGFNGKTFEESAYVQITIVKTTTTSSTTPSTTPAGQSTAKPPVTDPQISEGGLGTGAIVGIAIGCIVIIVLVVIAVVCIIKRRQTKDDSIDEPPEKPRNNQNLSFVNRPDIVNNDKNSPFYSQVEKKPYGSDVQYSDVTFEDKPRSRKPIQLYENGLDNAPYGDRNQGPYMPTV